MKLRLLLLAALLVQGESVAGPYSAGLGDPGNASDAPVPGFVGPEVNPIFFRWALQATDYFRADNQSAYADADLALGAVTGDLFDVLALGDLTAAHIAQRCGRGKSDAAIHRRDAPGPDPRFAGRGLRGFRKWLRRYSQ